MRRSDREINSREEILGILNKCDVLRLGINAPDYPYVVPMNFGFDVENDCITIWLHCAFDGLKLELLNKNPKVGFEADCSHKIIAGEKACNYTMEYESVIGNGRITVCDYSEDKLRGLRLIMKHYEPEKDFDFPETAVKSVCVLRLDVMRITGKRRKK